jgi:small subunit ribosomal protein S4e
MIAKRTTAPLFWPIERKTKKFIVSTLPGPHPKKNSIPLAVVLRDVLKHAETLREAKIILNKDSVKVDGLIRKRYKFPVGIMDIVSVGQETYRIMPGKKGLYMKPVKGKESTIKLLKLRNKTYIKGKIQLNFHDGKNMLSDNSSYKVGDTIIYDILSKKITGHIKMKKGSVAIVSKGKNSGTVGRIKDIKKTLGSEPNQVILESDKNEITVPHEYIYAIGESTPIIDAGA